MSAVDVYRPCDRVWASVNGQPPSVEILFKIENGQAWVVGPELGFGDGVYWGTHIRASVLGKAMGS